MQASRNEFMLRWDAVTGHWSADTNGLHKLVQINSATYWTTEGGKNDLIIIEYWKCRYIIGSFEVNMWTYFVWSVITMFLASENMISLYVEIWWRFEIEGFLWGFWGCSPFAPCLILWILYWCHHCRLLTTSTTWRRLSSLFLPWRYHSNQVLSSSLWCPWIFHSI